MALVSKDRTKISQGLLPIKIDAITMRIYLTNFRALETISKVFKPILERCNHRLKSIIKI